GMIFWRPAIRRASIFFDGSVPAQGTDGLRFACRRAGGGETALFRIAAILFGGFRVLRPRVLFRCAYPNPHPGSLFVRTESDQKTAQGRDPFDGVPPVCIPPPQRHKGGRMPPFGYPRIAYGHPLLSGRLPKD